MRSKAIRNWITSGGGGGSSGGRRQQASGKDKWGGSNEDCSQVYENKGLKLRKSLPYSHHSKIVIKCEGFGEVRCGGACAGGC